MHPPLNIDTGPFSVEELRLKNKQMVEAKVDGDDCISPELMKRVDVDDIILKFCNEVLCDSHISGQWKLLSNIVPVSKKGASQRQINTEEYF